MGAAYCFLEFEEERDAEVNRVLKEIKEVVSVNLNKKKVII